MTFGFGFGPTGGGGQSITNKSINVPATATGVLFTPARLLGPSSTFQKNSGDTNLSASSSNGAIAAAAALGAGVSQVIVIQENHPDGRGVIFKVTLIGASVKPDAPAVTLTPGNGQISVGWVDGSNGGSPIQSHNIYDNGVLIASPTGASPYVITGLPNGVLHGPIQVSAVNGIGEGPLSAGQSAKPVAVVPLLAGSRFAPMGNAQGQNGDGMSNGTDNDQNSRITSFNYTGAIIDKMQLVFCGWAENGGVVVNCPNAFTIESASIEYPQGTFTPVTFNGGAASVVVNPGDTLKTDIASLLSSIPDGAQYWMRCRVLCAPGGKFPMGYIINTNLGEAADFNTGTSKVSAGTITNASNTVARRAFGPVAALATSVTGTRKPIAVAGIGDSIINGTGTRINFGGGSGWLGDAAYLNKVPYFNCSRPGARGDQAVGLLGGPLLNLLAMIGVTHGVVDYGVNDISNNRSAAQTFAAMQGIWNALSGIGLKVYQTTITPSSTSASGTTEPGSWYTSTGQTARSGGAGPTIALGQFTGGANSERSKFNAMVRAIPTPLAGIIEVADAVELSRDAGVWRTGTDPSPPAQLMAPQLLTPAGSGSTVSVINATVNGGAGVLANGGILVWRTGPNAGTVSPVTSNTATTITLYTNLPNAPTAGDQFDMYPVYCSATPDGLHPAGPNVYQNGVVKYGGAAIMAQVGSAWLASL